jgi:NAD(P)-dependent dehydrogenase (short-subunit alcohol dehydrogenase family)
VSAASAVVVGASGGLGAAFVDALLEDGRFETVVALSRRGSVDRPTRPGLLRGALDLLDEPGIARAAAALQDLAPVRLVIVATGLLHAPDGLRPEKTLGSLDPARLARLFAVNATGPALVAKHFLPKMPRQGRVVFAAVSARVGSIGDNRLGGWYGYRASKAALNMLLRTTAIEWARSAKESVCIGLHPGTVDTALSAPFQSGVSEGRLFTPAHSARCLLQVIARRTPADTGRVFAWDGTEVPA